MCCQLPVSLVREEDRQEGGFLHAALWFQAAGVETKRSASSTPGSPDVLCKSVPHRSACHTGLRAALCLPEAGWLCRWQDTCRPRVGTLSRGST